MQSRWTMQSQMSNTGKFLGGLVLVGGVHAAESERIHVFDEQHVTATGLPTTAASASQHITILHRAELDALRGLSISEILQRQAGVVIDRSPRSGGFGSLFLRGADPSHVVVLIDHVRQNDPLSSRGSAVDLNTLSTDDIERIEIVRGNASVVNAEAMAGLIHIFTRRATAGSRFGTHIGGDGLRGAQASWSGTGLSTSVSHREDGDGVDGEQRTRSANAAWEHLIGDRATVGAMLRASDSSGFGFPDDSGGERYAELRQLESRESDSHQLALRSDIGVGNVGSLQIQAARLSRGGDESSPGVAPGVRDPFGLPAIETRSDYRRNELQALWLTPLGPEVLFTLGAQYQRESGTLDSLIHFDGFSVPALFDRRRATTSAFSEARWQHGDWTLQGGLRSEHPDSGDATTHPMLSFQHTLGDARGHWGASLAGSSKQPSFYALGHPLVGNALLKPERARHREIYYATPANSAWRTRLTLFSARYQDLVDFDSGPPPQLVNRARIDAEGVEWRSIRTFDNDWRLQLEGTWMRVRDPDGQITLRHRPRLQSAVQLHVPVAGERELSVMARHVGRRFDSSIATGDRWLDAVTTMDVSMQQPLGPLHLTLALENAFDSAEEESIGTPTPGRRLYLSLDWPLR
jgi:vitamin B12 transporter